MWAGQRTHGGDQPLPLKSFSNWPTHAAAPVSQVLKSMFWEHPKLLLMASVIKILICKNNSTSLTESSRKLEEAMSYEDSEEGLAHSGHWMRMNWYHYPEYGGLENLLILTTRITSFLNTDTKLPPIPGSRRCQPLDLLSTRYLQAGCQKDYSVPQEHSEHTGASYYPSAPRLWTLMLEMNSSVSATKPNPTWTTFLCPLLALKGQHSEYQRRISMANTSFTGPRWRRQPHKSALNKISCLMVKAPEHLIKAG